MFGVRKTQGETARWKLDKLLLKSAKSQERGCLLRATAVCSAHLQMKSSTCDLGGGLRAPRDLHRNPSPPLLRKLALHGSNVRCCRRLLLFVYFLLLLQELLTQAGGGYIKDSVRILTAFLHVSCSNNIW